MWARGSGGGKPGSVVLGELVVALLSAFEPGDGGGPDAEVLRRRRRG